MEPFIVVAKERITRSCLLQVNSGIVLSNTGFLLPEPYQLNINGQIGLDLTYRVK